MGSDTFQKWEYAIPPEFILDGDNYEVWTSYPDSTDPGCPDGWWDHAHDDYPDHDCIPIQADLWGSNYLVFRADTTYYSSHDWVDTLVVEFDWSGELGMHVELWLSVLTYPKSRDNLFLYGEELLDYETYRFTSPDRTAEVRVPAFHKDAVEAVVIVLTVVDRDYSIDHEGACLKRKAYWESHVRT